MLATVYCVIPNSRKKIHDDPMTIITYSCQHGTLHIVVFSENIMLHSKGTFVKHIDCGSYFTIEWLWKTVRCCISNRCKYKVFITKLRQVGKRGKNQMYLYTNHFTNWMCVYISNTKNVYNDTNKYYVITVGA